MRLGISVSECLGVALRVIRVRVRPDVCVCELDRKLPEGRNTCFVHRSTQRQHKVSIQ